MENEKRTVLEIGAFSVGTNSKDFLLTVQKMKDFVLGVVIAVVIFLLSVFVSYLGYLLVFYDCFIYVLVFGFFWKGKNYMAAGITVGAFFCIFYPYLLNFLA